MKERKMMPLAVLRGFAVCLAAWLLFQASPTPASSANTSTSYTTVTIPFTAFRGDANYRPHQLITIKIQKDKSSPAIPATFLFDTGANESCISTSLAQKLGLPQYSIVQRDGTQSTLEGKPILGIQAAAVAIGDLHIEGFRFQVLSDQRLSLDSSQAIDGVLGTDVLSFFVTQIDFAQSKITFIVPANTIFYYDTLSKNPVELSSTEIVRQGFNQAVTVPLIAANGSFFASTVLSNGQSIVTDLLTIDSGADATLLSQQTTQKLNLKTMSTRTTTNILGQYIVQQAWLPSLSSGDLKLDNLLVFSPTKPKMQPYTALGLDVLANYNILLDFPHRKMYLKPRGDLQVVTSHQYEAASPAQRRQWAQTTLAIAYPTSTFDISLAIPYDLTADGLPLAQVRPDLVTPPVPFLLKSNISNTFMSETLAQKWRMNAQMLLDDAGKPRLLDRQIVRLTTVSNLHIAGILVSGQIGVFPADWVFSWASYLSLQGVVGANILFAKPLLMDPTLQTWMQLVRLAPEELPSLGMADAAVVDILDPDSDGIPAIAVQMQQGTAKFTETSTLATGSAFTLLSAQAAQALKLTPEPQKLRYGTGKDLTVFNQAHLSQMVIGGVVLKDVQVAYPDGAMPDGYYPRLGMNVLSKLRLLVDTHAKKLYVKKAGG